MDSLDFGSEGNMFEVSELWCYPIKGLRGYRVNEIYLEQRGPQWDRRWMLVDAELDFLSQRKLPKMALIQTAYRDGVLELSAEGFEPFHLPVDRVRPQRAEASLFGKAIDAPFVCKQADAWFSKVLGQPCRLMRCDKTVNRPLNPHFKLSDHQVSFADLAPVLITTPSSLDQLNQQVEPTMTQRHFRPNIVVSCTDPFIEHYWSSLEIGQAVLGSGRACTRCQVIAVDPQTGESGDKDPIHDALKKLNLRNGKVNFGQVFAVVKEGVVRVGDAVKVTSTESD